VTYLVIAYAFAIVVLGGFIVWSLRTLRALERKP
jgi:heme exporter protein CcmD